MNVQNFVCFQYFGESILTQSICDGQIQTCDMLSSRCVFDADFDANLVRFVMSAHRLLPHQL